MSSSMRVGVDEAGYGPTLGPLVLASSSFVLPADAPENLWQALAPLVRKKRKKKDQRGTIWIDDSKTIKGAARGLEHLEVAVLAFVCLAGEWPETVADLLPRLGVDPALFQGLPWYGSLLERALPAHGWRSDILDKSARLADALERAEMRFLGLRAAPLLAREFNAGIERTDNKATVHIETLTPLLKAALAQQPDDLALTIVCDKLGGRDRYGPVIGRLFPGRPVKINAQGSKLSRYAITADQRPIELVFRQKADANHLPVALSSMLCKYLRELAMDALNDHFQGLKPGLKKTAGYPVDARRFLAEIDDLIPALGVPSSWLIRSR